MCHEAWFHTATTIATDFIKQVNVVSPPRKWKVIPEGNFYCFGNTIYTTG
jgi:hypothetical protein